MVTTASGFPASAIDWLADSRARLATLVVDRGSTPALRPLAGKHDLVVIDPSATGVAAMRERAGAAMPIVAEPEALPFAPCSFDRVLVGQSFHTLAPGLALAEFARVLRPGGSIAIFYTIRDNSVPWVRRLVALLQGADPTAMTGAYGDDSVEALTESPYFPRLETRRFRQWIPIDQPGLAAMVGRSPQVRALPEDRRTELLDEVAALYRASARVPEPLLLPYQVLCWRAVVDHSELSAPLEITDPGLQIHL